MTDKEARRILLDIADQMPSDVCADWIDAIGVGVQAIDAQHCEEAVSREAVDKLSRDLVHVTRDKADFLCNFWEGLNALPSVTPQPKIGHWIIIDDCEQFIAKCSECGRTEDSRMISKYPYCHCGAKMEV